MYSRVRRKALSQPVRLLSLVWVLFWELSKAEFVPLRNSYSFVCHGCMGWSESCAELEEGRRETANKLTK